MTELQSALLLRRQLAGERESGGAPGRAAIAASRCGSPSFPPRPAAGLPRGSGSRRLGRVLAREGEELEAPAGPVRAQHFFPGFQRVLGAGTRPSLSAGTGPAALWKGGEAAPSPTAGWDVAGEGLWVPSPDRPSQEGRVPGSGAAEAAGPLRATGASGPT